MSGTYELSSRLGDSSKDSHRCDFGAPGGYDPRTCSFFYHLGAIHNLPVLEYDQVMYLNFGRYKANMPNMSPRQRSERTHAATN